MIAAKTGASSRIGIG